MKLLAGLLHVVEMAKRSITSEEQQRESDREM